MSEAKQAPLGVSIYQYRSSKQFLVQAGTQVAHFVNEHDAQRFAQRISGSADPFKVSSIEFAPNVSKLD